MSQFLKTNRILISMYLPMYLCMNVCIHLSMYLLLYLQHACIYEHIYVYLSTDVSVYHLCISPVASVSLEKLTDSAIYSLARV